MIAFCKPADHDFEASDELQVDNLKCRAKFLHAAKFNLFWYLSYGHGNLLSPPWSRKRQISISGRWREKLPPVAG